MTCPQAENSIASKKKCSRNLTEKWGAGREKVVRAIYGITIDANNELLFDLRAVIELDVRAMNHGRPLIAIEENVD